MSVGRYSLGFASRVRHYSALRRNEQVKLWLRPGGRSGDLTAEIYRRPKLSPLVLGICSNELLAVSRSWLPQRNQGQDDEVRIGAQR